MGFPRVGDSLGRHCPVSRRLLISTPPSSPRGNNQNCPRTLLNVPPRGKRLPEDPTYNLSRSAA